MARPLRIEYENAWYHVMNRGAAHQDIFITREHYELYLQLLSEIQQRFQIEIHAYCLMPNHYHLLLKTPLPNLSRAMRHLNSLYTRKFNNLCQRDGPLFRGRFKSIIVDSENYLLQLSRYIHLNPVKAGLVKTPEKFRWSSYQFFLDKKNKPDWLYCDETLNQFSNRLRHKQYQLFVNEGIDNELDSFYQKIQRVPILGTEAFTKTITEKYLKDKPLDPEISEQRNTLHKQLPSIKKIFQLTAHFYQIPIEHLNSKQFKQKNIPRSMAIYLAIHYAQASLNQVAHFLGNVSYSAIAKAYARFREHLDEDKKAAESLGVITRLLMQEQ